MSTGDQLEVVSIDGQGPGARKYATSVTGSDRGIFTAAGMIAASIVWSIKDFAYGATATLQSKLDTDDAPPDERSRARVTDSDVQPLESDASTANSRAKAPPEDKGAAGSKKTVAQHASLDADESAGPSGGVGSGGSRVAPLVEVSFPRPAIANDNPSPINPRANGVAHDAAAPTADSKGDVGALDGGDRNRNRSPYATGATILDDLAVNTAIILTLSELLRHIRDDDKDALSVRNVSASSGQITDNGNGTWTFVPKADDVTDVTIKYLVTDGHEIIQQTAMLDLVDFSTNDIAGTDGNDVVDGTPQANVIRSLGGHDLVHSLKGDDVVYAGDGNDSIDAGEGDDVVLAGNGNDVIHGGSGNDILFGEAGNDVIYGDDGDDVISGGDGDDAIAGGVGADKISGGKDSDEIAGDAGNDLLSGDAGADVISGGDGDDAIAGGAGADKISGGKDSDEIAGDAGNDLLSGDAGADVISGGDGDDAIDGGAGADKISGGEDSDEIAGGAGNDLLSGDAGADVISGGQGNDTVVASLDDGDDKYDGGAGTDTYNSSAVSSDTTVDLSSGTAESDETGTDELANFENVVTGAGSDTIIANGNVNSLTGGEGHDTFVFQSAQDCGAPTEGWDTITDFEVGDKIDISSVDSDVAVEGLQKLEFVGNIDHFSKARELRYRIDDDERGSHTFVLGNTNDDLGEDFIFEIRGSYQLTIEDFAGLLPV